MFKNKLKAIIGAGHLGGALARGLIKSGHPANSFIFSNRNLSKATRLAAELGVLSAETNTQAVEDADVVILAVKPQFMKEVCLEIAPVLEKKRTIIISLAGVITIDTISEWLTNKNSPVIRVMSNTPTEFCKGTSALFASTTTSLVLRDAIQELFNEVGYTFWVDQESMLDTLTAPIGCAPAYVFLFLEALQKAAISTGIPEQLSGQIALEAVIGAAELAKKSGHSFAKLREGVTTPHGVTEHSLQKISSEDFFDLFKQVYAAAAERIIHLKDYNS